MNTSFKFLLALYSACSLFASAPALAQDAPDAPPAAPPTDDVLIFPGMPPAEPMFDFMDEMMVSEAPAAPPLPFTMPVPLPDGDSFYVAVGPDGPGGPGGPGGRGMARFHHGRNFGGGACPALSGELALKDDQLEKLHAIKNQMLDAVGAQRANQDSYRRQLRDLLSAPTLDRPKITALQQKINDAQAAVSTARLNSLMASHDVLTPEQLKAIREQYLKGGGMGGDSCPGGFGGFSFRARRHGF